MRSPVACYIKTIKNVLAIAARRFLSLFNIRAVNENLNEKERENCLGTNVGIENQDGLWFCVFLLQLRRVHKFHLNQ